MAKLHLLHERRAAHRPFNGDVVLCPKCCSFTFEFNARFRVVLESGKTVRVPAWMCDDPNCQFVHFARREDSTLRAFMPSVERQARIPLKKSLGSGGNQTRRKSG